MASIAGALIDWAERTGSRLTAEQLADIPFEQAKIFAADIARHASVEARCEAAALRQRRAELVAAAEDWEAQADQSEERARKDRELGIDGCAPGQSPGDHRARTFRACAASLRAEARTGLEHCTCHGLALTRQPDGRACEHVGQPRAC